MRKATLVLTALLAGASATPAFAQMTGRVELKAGYDEARATVQIQRTISPEEFGHGNAAAGVEVGGDFNFDGVGLIGAYAGMDFSGTNACEDDLFFEFDRFCIKSHRNSYAGLRAGLKIGNSG